MRRSRQMLQFKSTDKIGEGKTWLRLRGEGKENGFRSYIGWLTSLSLVVRSKCWFHQRKELHVTLWLTLCLLIITVLPIIKTGDISYEKCLAIFYWSIFLKQYIVPLFLPYLIDIERVKQGCQLLAKTCKECIKCMSQRY